MVRLFKPTPILSGLDQADAGYRYAKSSSNHGLKFLRSTNLVNVIFSQLGTGGFLAAIVRPMDQAISLVSGGRLPAQMSFGGASLMALSARMSGVMFWCRGWSVHHFTNNSGSGLHSPAVPDLSNPIGHRAKRPLQTVVSIVGHDDFAQVARRLTLRRPAAERVAVIAPPLVVAAAPSAMFDGLVASVDSAYSLISHLRSFRDRSWSGPKTVLTHRFGPLFMPENANKYNCVRA